MINWLKKFFATKRIFEEDGYFYPQKWDFTILSWKYYDKEDGYLWTNQIIGENRSRCRSLNEAKQVLNKFKNTLEKPNKIYHYV